MIGVIIVLMGTTVVDILVFDLYSLYSYDCVSITFFIIYGNMRCVTTIRFGVYWDTQCIKRYTARKPGDLVYSES